MDSKRTRRRGHRANARYLRRIRAGQRRALPPLAKRACAAWPDDAPIIRKFLQQYLTNRAQRLSAGNRLHAGRPRLGQGQATVGTGTAAQPACAGGAWKKTKKKELREPLFPSYRI